jgi:hypothetical protein
MGIYSLRPVHYDLGMKASTLVSLKDQEEKEKAQELPGENNFALNITSGLRISFLFRFFLLFLMQVSNLMMMSKIPSDGLVCALLVLWKFVKRNSSKVFSFPSLRLGSPFSLSSQSSSIDS